MSSLMYIPNSPEFYKEIMDAAMPMFQAQTSLYEFVKLFWPVIEPRQPFVDGFHVKAICDHLEGISKGSITQDIIFNIPPRCAKSSITCVMWPAWDWIENPGRRFIYAAHKLDLSIRDAVRCKDVMLSELYQKYWSTKFYLTKDTAKFYENNHRGFRKCASPEAGITGEGSDFIIVDDLNDTTQVMSDAIRGKTNLWYSATLSTRLNDLKRGRIIITAQRCHEMDVSGYAGEGGNFIKVVLPMEYEPNRKCKTVSLRKGDKVWEDPRTKPGELLWPEKIGPEELKRLKDGLKTEYRISGQLQQRPSPEEGGIIKKTFFNWWKHPEPPKKLKLVVQSWDTALTDKDRQTNAYSACTTWGVFDDFGEDQENMSGIPNVILLAASRYRIEYPELRKMAQRLSLHYNDTKEKFPIKPDGHHVPNLILIEEKASGRPLTQDLRRAGVMATPFIPDKFGDKTQRVIMCTPIMECGKVWLPANPYSGYKTLLPFAEEFQEQCCLFPNADSRDYVDSMTQVLLRVIQSRLLYNSNDPRNIYSDLGPEKTFYGIDKD